MTQYVGGLPAALESCARMCVLCLCALTAGFCVTILAAVPTVSGSHRGKDWQNMTAQWQ